MYYVYCTDISAWPAGDYAIPRTVFDCPQSDYVTWLTGSLTLSTRDTEPGTNTWTVSYHGLGPYTQTSVTLNVCVKVEGLISPY